MAEATEITYLPIADFPAYRVGNDGSIWSRKNNRHGVGEKWKRLRTSDRGDGYLRVTIYQGSRRRVAMVQHLVLEAFVGPRPKGLLGLHQDGNRTNNAVGNLYWGTYSDNVTDSIRHKTHYTPFRSPGAIRRRRQFTDEQIDGMKRMRAEGASLRSIAKTFGASFGYIGRVLRKERRS